MSRSLRSLAHLDAFRILHGTSSQADLLFDAVLAVNNVGFWSETEVRLAGVRHMLRPGGLIAVAHQPREPGATDETSAAEGREIAGALARAGISEVRVETLRLKPAVVCALGMNGSAT